MSASDGVFSTNSTSSSSGSCDTLVERRKNSTADAGDNEDVFPSSSESSQPKSDSKGLDFQKQIYHICDSRKNNPIQIGEILQRKHTTVIYFIRRFGCYLTRMISNDLNLGLIPKLKSHMQFIVIASENIGYEDFLDSNFLSNMPITHFYYDPSFSSFSNLEFKRSSGLGILLETFSPKTLKMTNKAISSGITADLVGDIYQFGGLLIFKGGQVKYVYKQKKVSDFMQCDDILYNIDPHWNHRRLSRLNKVNSTESGVSNNTSCSSCDAQNRFRTVRH